MLLKTVSQGNLRVSPNAAFVKFSTTLHNESLLIETEQFEALRSDLVVALPRHRRPKQHRQKKDAVSLSELVICALKK